MSPSITDRAAAFLQALLANPRIIRRTSNDVWEEEALALVGLAFRLADAVVVEANARARGSRCQ